MANLYNQITDKTILAKYLILNTVLLLITASSTLYLAMTAFFTVKWL